MIPSPESRRGLMLVLSSPSGAGKTTLSRKLLELHGQDPQGSLMMSVSVTTRPRRPNEVDGIDYHFISQEKFDGLVASGEMLEHAMVFGHRYGTPAAFVRQSLESGTDVLFDIDWQGTRQLAQKSREDLVSIFILPPSMQELERRLRSRGQDSEEVMARRMEKAVSEISHWQEYDYVFVNRDVGETLQQIDRVLHAERMKCLRQPWLKEFVEKLR